MKIGEFSRQFNIPVSTVRYYIRNGVLVPSQRGNNQFEFSEKDIRDMKYVSMLKGFCFSIDEIKQYLKIMRMFNYEDIDMLEHQTKIFEKKVRELHEDIDMKREAVSKLERRLANMQNRIIATKNSEHNEQTPTHSGLPLEFLQYMACPKCGRLLDDDIIIKHNRITSGSLKCTCGYEAAIEDGIILAPDESSHYKTKAFKVQHYQEVPPDDADFVFFRYIDDLNEEVISLMYQTYQEISNRINDIYFQKQQKPKLLFVPDLASHYLYQNINEPFFKDIFSDTIIIVTGFSKENILAIKSHIDSIAPGAKIVYIANTIFELPVIKESIDYWIDATSSYNFAFFNPYSLHGKISRYLKNGAHVVGLTKYYEPNSKSLKKIKERYDNELRNHSLINSFESILADEGYFLSFEKDVGYTKNPGSYYEYHVIGEKHKYLVYSAIKTDEVLT